MQFSIRKSGGRSILLQEGVSAPFDRMQHAWMQKWSYSDDQLLLFIEEYSSGPYTFRVIIMQLLNKLQLIWKDHLAGVKFTWTISNDSLFRSHQYIKTVETGHHRLNHDSLFRSYQYIKKITSEVKLPVNEPGEYKVIDFICDAEKMKQFETIFPGIEARLNEHFVQKKRISPEVAKILIAIDTNPYDGVVRDIYIETKVEELLLVVFYQASSAMTVQEEKNVNEKEVDAVHKAESLIMEDISKHYTIKELSRLVGLNQVRLKAVFKEIYREGMFERLLHARMHHAHELIIGTDKPMKEIASLTGYMFLTSFINAFREYHGYTPGSLRRK